MLFAHRVLWETCDISIVVSLYDALSPTPKRVWSMVVEPLFKNSAESRMFEFLRRFILLQCTKRLSTLLLFIMGKPQCGMQSCELLCT